MEAESLKYVLSEETLEKDIDQFIRAARKGAFVMDPKHDKEGLQILREYIRLIQQAFKDLTSPIFLLTTSLIE